MRLKQNIFLSFICVAAVAAFADDDAKPIALAETPAAVQKTIHAQVADGKLGEIDRVIEDGEIVFDVSLTAKSGDEIDFTVADDGTLLSVEVKLADTPAAVQKTVQAQATGWELVSIDKNLDDTEISFDVVTTKDGLEKSFSVGADGTLLSIDVGLPETPAVVQKTIQARLVDCKLKAISEMFDENGITYDVTFFSKNGGQTSFTVTAEGKLVSEQTTLEQTPPAVRETIKEKIGDGKVLRIDKSLLEKESRVLPYEVQGRKDGKPFDFSVGPKGRFLGMDD